MAKVENPSRRDITLPTRHVIPAQGQLETTNEVLRCADNAPMLAGLALSGQVAITYDPEIDASADMLPAARSDVSHDTGTKAVEPADQSQKKK